MHPAQPVSPVEQDPGMLRTTVGSFVEAAQRVFPTRGQFVGGLAIVASAFGSGSPVAAEGSSRDGGQSVRAAMLETQDSIQLNSGEGKMVLSNAGGRYDRALVTARNDDAKKRGLPDDGKTENKAVCEGKVLEDEPRRGIVVELNKSGHTEINCSGPESYVAYFFTKRQTLSQRGMSHNNDRSTPTVYDRSCTYVTKGQAGVKRVADMDTGGKCPKSFDISGGVKKRRSVKIDAGYYSDTLPHKVVRRGKPYVQFHEVSAKNGGRLKQEDCAGQMIIYHRSGTGNKVREDPGRAYPIMYNPKTGTCIFYDSVSGKFSSGLRPQEEDRRWKLPGNAYLKSADTIEPFTRK